MKDQLSAQIDLIRLFDPASGGGLVQSLVLRGASVARADGVACCVLGSPRFDNPTGAARTEERGVADGLLGMWRKHGAAMAASLQGGYALMIVDAVKRCVFLAVDRFAIETLCYRLDGNSLAVSDRADCVEGCGRELDPQAIFDYLYFHMIPAPRTIFRSVRRLPAAHSLLIDSAGAHESRHWPLRFEEHVRPSFPVARDALRQLVRDAVAREVAGESKVGCFLSGGTDSSTVAGMLCQITGKATPAYSIGFEAEGYDEMEYARLAARHFGCEHHEYYVTPKDLLDSIPAVAQHFDQPFGNASALPAYYCAKMAADDGCTKLLAGDGGDELFGGNSRYAMQRFLELYQGVPMGLRRLIEPMCGDDSVLRRIPGLRQATGYVRHSRVQMPHRLQTMNHFMHLDPAEILPAVLRSLVDQEEPTRHMQGIWDECGTGHIVNRMLAYDWRYTLADSDLPKVRGATSMAGLAVAFPLLDDRLTDFSMGLPPDWKLKRFRLRWFFKEAMRGFLPDAIIRKKKQGFGLPHGRWVAGSPQLRKFAQDNLNGLAERGVVQQQFVSTLLEQRLPEHPAYYGEMIWLLMMLEQWMQGHEGVYIST